MVLISGKVVGAIKQFTYGNGIVHTMTRNARGLPEASKDAYGTTNLLYDAYDYDQTGNVAAITDGATGQAQRGNRTMTYDGLDRLADVTSPMYGTACAHYTYDVLDNLVHTIAVNRDQWLCYDQTNQLTNVKVNGDCSTGSTILGLGFDPQGNLANWNGVEYAFDYGNRLRQVEALEAYRYDGHGRRVLATSLQGLGNLLSMYGQAGQLLYQHDSRAARMVDHVYLGGSLVAQRATAFSTGAVTVEYQHTDALGTPVAKTNASRVVVQRSEYEPYGKLLNRPLENGPGYTGHVTDAATQLTYMQQRYYDPRVGRFWSVDPVTAYSNGDMRFFNRYGYAFNNPYAFKDPDGRCPVCLVPLIPPAVAAAIDAAAFVGSAVIVAWAGNEAINSYNESADEGESAPLPEGLVGTQDVKSGLFGKTHDSGPLAPENDGTGNDEKGF